MPKPKLFALLKVASIFVMMGLILLSLFTEFIPAEFLQGRYWKWPALVVGILLTMLLHRRNRRLGLSLELDGEGRVTKVAMFFGMPVMMGFLFWLLLAKTLPWLLTLTFGSEFEEAYVMQTYYQSSAGCKYQLRGGPVEHAFPNYLCINEVSYLRYPDQQIAVTLKGERSFLGSRVSKIYGPQ
ncbi:MULTISPECIES: hypothetical protein [Xanthomonas]|uniref:DUF5673 domain-containing protein n=1 Tax=Xanthomonas dyei TaxID=743699 RepID=A0ABZ0DE18_9XANT|nr:hypothetical protein [Xanthomonas dyei]WOB28531.1 hypothetical protein NYR99_05815 [Xanthomonas dyei]WOB56151.1 hypothetical protein NYR95_05820 [Xanthomonas dyei]